MAISAYTAAAHVDQHQAGSIDVAYAEPPNPTAGSSTPEFHTIRLTSADVAQYNKLPLLVAMINESFSAVARKFEGLYESETKRYEAPEDFVREMGPEGVTFITEKSCTGKDPEPIATAGYKAWKEVGAVQARITTGFQISETPLYQEIQDSMPAFEVVAVAVDTAYQNYGLSAQLQQRVTEDVALMMKTTGEKDFRLRIRTLKEINEPYWTRKGYMYVLSESCPSC